MDSVITNVPLTGRGVQSHSKTPFKSNLQPYIYILILYIRGWNVETSDFSGHHWTQILRIPLYTRSCHRVLLRHKDGFTHGAILRHGFVRSKSTTKSTYFTCGFGCGLCVTKGDVCGNSLSKSAGKSSCVWHSPTWSLAAIQTANGHRLLVFSCIYAMCKLCTVVLISHFGSFLSFGRWQSDSESVGRVPRVFIQVYPL